MRAISIYRLLAPHGLKSDQNYSKEASEGEYRYIKDGNLCTCGSHCKCSHCKARNVFKCLKTIPQYCRDFLKEFTPKGLIFPLSQKKFMKPSTYEFRSLWRPLDPMPGSVRLIKIQNTIAITSKLLSEQLNRSNQPSLQNK